MFDEHGAQSLSEHGHGSDSQVCVSLHVSWTISGSGARELWADPWFPLTHKQF